MSPELDTNKPLRALKMLQEAALIITPELSLNDILKKTVELTSQLMETHGNPKRYFSHLAVKEGNRVYFDANHNLPEAQKMLQTSLEGNAEIDLSSAHIGITGRAALTGETKFVLDVRQDKDYIDLKGAGGSQISVPIIIDDEVFAILNIEHEDKYAFDEQDVQTVEALAKQVGSVIVNRERSVAYNALFTAVKAFTTATDLAAMLQEIAQQAFYLMEVKTRKPGSFAHVALKEGSLLRYIAAYPRKTLERFGEETYTTRDLSGDIKPHTIGISGRAAIEGETKNVPDVSNDWDYLNVNLDKESEESRINSQLAVPFKVDGEVVGVISIDHPAFNAFSPRDVNNIEILAELAADFYRTNLHNERQRQALTTLQQAAIEITRLISVDEILCRTGSFAQRIVERSLKTRRQFVSHVARVENNVLSFMKEHNTEYVHNLFVLSGYERIDLSNPEEYHGIVGRVAKTGKAELIGNVATDPDYFDIRGSGSQLSVPIIVAGNVFGVVSVEHDNVDYFDEQDKYTLEALAVLVGTIIDIIQNRTLNQQKSLFISSLAHESKSPISVILGFLDNIDRKRYTGFDDGDFIEGLKAALKEARSQSDLINDLLDEMREETGKLQLRIQDALLSEIIQVAAQSLLKRAREKNLALHIQLPSDDLLPTQCDVGRVERVIKNLIDNAIKFTSEGSITIRAFRQNSHVMIQVEDTGAGIPEDHKDLIFDALYQVHTSLTREAGGLGLGLHLARKYVERHGGNMWVESIVGKGSTFFVLIPLSQPQEEYTHE